MCIPHGAAGTKSNGYVETKQKKHVVRVSQEVFEKGDPNFVDERITEYIKPKPKKSFISSLFES